MIPSKPLLLPLLVMAAVALIFGVNMVIASVPWPDACRTT